MSETPLLPLHSVPVNQQSLESRPQGPLASSVADHPLERIRAVVEQLADALVVYDPAWRCVYVNPAAKRAFQIVGLPADLWGKTVWDMFPDLVGSTLEQRLLEGVQQQEYRSCEMLFAALGVWVQVDVYPSAQGASVFFRTITQRHTAQQQLQASEERYRHLIETMREGMALVTADFRIEYLNPQLVRLLGYQEPGEVLGRSALDFIDPAYQAEARRQMEGRRQGVVEPLELPLTRQDGTTLWVEVSATSLIDQRREVTGIIGLLTDITERKRVERALLERQTFAHELLESITDAFCACDADWNFIYVNAQAARLLGCRATDLLGRRGWDVFPEAWGGVMEHNLKVTMDERRSMEFEVYSAQHGVWFQLHSYPSGDGIAVCFRDVSVRKAAEQLEQARNQILERTLRNEPLGTILSEIALLVEGHNPGLLSYVMLRQGDVLYNAAAPSLPAGFTDAVSSVRIEPEAGPCGAAAFLGVSITVESFFSNSSWGELRELALVHGLRACLSAPILSGTGEVLGTLCAYSRSTGTFPAVTVDLLQQARHLAAVAIEHHRLRDSLAYQTQHDALTGLPNRTLFNTRLEGAAQQAKAHQTPVALAHIDLDDFKSINDVHGNQVGDEVLREITRRLLQLTRFGDTLARVGGDEFTVVLPHTTQEAAETIMRQILRSLTAPILVGEQELLISASIGISMLTNGVDVTHLQRHADLAMQSAKIHKAGIAFYQPEMNRRAAERMHLAQYLRRAVELDELELHYQPQVNLIDGTLTGMEALLRWRHPLLGHVAPLRFIPVAEETGLIVPIGEWVLREACRQTAVWRRQGYEALRIAVNVSVLQFERDGFVQMVAQVLEDTGLCPEALELELTESAVMRNVEESARRMNQLRALGVSLAVDDFGTGYSSLSYLSRLPLNVLKIDRSFVTHLHQDSFALPVVRAITSLAHNLGLTTIAEGIETQQECDLLRELGCHQGQGYLIARPLPASEALPAQKGLFGLESVLRTSG
ncbi:EAL domain-containing protein [Deinococcus sp. QL22]|uniref:bifunctional diguanylate cyclase/phosphodiesterase n=1 Tax=Deinococcus sp. QL22 TaxID=2939437 RepID=UPI0020181C60|nr:EAL domain-containing protein [Deinococcus sp. QL22]UQN08661.1 EAL domain-containing protein [Deinococcus sp. QL22]